MKTIILLDLEDIETHEMGTHFNIQTKEGTIINFTREAFYELLTDMKKIEELHIKIDSDLETNL